MKQPESFLATDDALIDPNNTTWDEVNRIYLNSIQVINATAQLGGVVKRKDVIAAVKDIGELTILMRSLIRDLASIKRRLNAVHVKHNYKFGPANNANDFFEAIGLSEEYHSIMSDYQLAVAPNVDRITKIIVDTGLKV